ncbi:hypothetical protein CTI14_46140 [Methylobacterium radiotolerans]|nr:hypothetical protein CTI14_46140 [Methylobacterium radiotolerans]
MVRYAESLQSRGLLTRAESLKSDAEGVRLSIRDGERQLMDGPYAEAKEMIGGFFLSRPAVRGVCSLLRESPCLTCC